MVGEEPMGMSLQFSVFQLWIPISSFEAWISMKAKKLSSLSNTRKSTTDVNVSHSSAIAVASTNPVLLVSGNPGV